MQKAWSIINRNQRGFSVVEILLAATVFGMLTFGLIGAIIYGRSSAADAGDHQRATQIADEGLEAARNIARASYSNLSDGTYGLAQSSGAWALSGTSDTSDIYTRQITVASAGTNRKTVTSTVTWPQVTGGTATVTMTTRLVNWAAVIKSWSNGIVGGSADATGTADGLKVSIAGNYAYIVRNATSNNLIVVDISTPTAPSIVKTMTVTGTPTNIDVSNGYAYVTTTTAASGLQIFSLSTPTTPTLVKTVSFPGTAANRAVRVSGNYAYVGRAADITANANEFTVVNVATPASAAIVGGTDSLQQVNALYVNGNYVYAAVTNTILQPMQIFNVTTPTAPSLVSSYVSLTLAASNAIAGNGSTIYLGYGVLMESLDLSNPTSAVRLGSYTAPSTINDISLDTTGGYAFLGTSSTTAEFQVVNIANPASMSLVKSVDVAGTASTVNGVAYSSAYDVVVGASAADTLEALIFTKN